MPNKIRGEVECDFGTRKITLVPTYEAQTGIEDDLGEGLIEASDRIFDGKYGIKEIFLVIKHGAIAGGTEIEDAELGELIAQSGLQAMSLPMITFLTMCHSGWSKDSGETKNLTAVPSA